MTHNQISLLRLNEEQRANKVREGISIANAVLNPLSHITTAVTRALNHPEGYADNPQLVQDVASVPFNAPLGSQSIASFGVNGPVWGIATYSYMTGIGSTREGEFSAINIAAKNTFAVVRYENSGATNYEAVDMMMYLIAVIDAYKYGALLRRIYKSLITYNNANGFEGERLAASVGLNSKELLKNLAEFRAHINLLGQQLSAFALPADLPVVARALGLNSFVFKDKDIPRSQLHHFTMRGFYTNNGVKGVLEFQPIDGSASGTLSQIRNYSEIIIKNLIAYEDIGIISGDIQKAFRQRGLVVVPDLAPNEALVPIYDKSILAQIESMTMVGDLNTLDPLVPEYSSYNITQENNIIYQGKSQEPDVTKRKKGVMSFVAFSVATTFDPAKFPTRPNHQPIIALNKGAVTPNDVMVASRLAATIGDFFAKRVVASSLELMSNALAYGSELVCTMALSNTFYPINSRKYATLNKASGTFIVAEFDHTPMLVGVSTANDTMGVSAGQSTHGRNGAQLTDSQLLQMHSVALQSLYGVGKLRNRFLIVQRQSTKQAPKQQEQKQKA